MTTWVLLRGLARERGHWADFPARLAAATGAAVIALDLPGNGTRWQERSPSAIAPMADDVLAQLDQLGLREPVSMLALSLGAMVALDLARRHPARVRHLVLASTSLRPWAPSHWRLRPAAAATLLWHLARGAPRPLEAAVLRLTSTRKHPAGATLIEDWLALRARAPVSRANALRQVLAAARFRLSTAPPVPALLLAGTGDVLVDPRCSERLAQVWGWPLRLHPWAGHDLPLDDPDWLVREVHAWIAASLITPPA